MKVGIQSALMFQTQPGPDQDENSNCQSALLDPSLSPMNLHLQLEKTLAANMTAVEDLALDTIAASQIPLISSRYTKPDVLSAVKNCRKIGNLQSRLLALVLITDQLVTGVVSHIVDIFHLSFNVGKMKALELLGKVWAETFVEVYNLRNTSSLKRPTKDVMVTVLEFLRRQKTILERLEDKSLGQSLFVKMNSNSQADHCFWTYSLETIDGRKKDRSPRSPVHSVTPVKLQLKKDLPVRAPSPLPPSPSLESPLMPEPETFHSSEMTSVPGSPSTLSTNCDSNTIELAVSKLMVSSYGFPNTKQKTSAGIKVHLDGMVNINIYGNSTNLQLKDFSEVVLSPGPEKPLLFLYLTAGGCNTVLSLLQKVPGVLCSPFSKGNQHARRLVVCLASLPPTHLEFLTSVFHNSLPDKFATVRSTYAQLLLLKVVDLSKAFQPKITKSPGQLAQDLVSDILEFLLEEVVSAVNSVDLISSIIKEETSESAELDTKEGTSLSIRNSDKEGNLVSTNDIGGSFTNMQNNSGDLELSQTQKRCNEDITEIQAKRVKMKDGDKLPSSISTRFPNNNVQEIVDLTQPSPKKKTPMTFNIFNVKSKDCAKKS